MSRARRRRRLLLVSQYVASLALCLTAATGVAWSIETRMTALLLGQILARAADQVALGLLPRVTPGDFEPPYTRAKLDDLSSRLAPVLDRAREHDSGIIRINLFARDGTVLYSDLASLRGQTVSPLSDQLLGEALGGSPNAEVTSLTGLENADLAPRYGSALEAYVPCVFDGRVAGVYEFYTDVGPIQPIRPIILTSTTVGFGLLLLSLLALERGRSRLVPMRRARAAEARAPAALAMGAVRLVPSAAPASPESASGLAVVDHATAAECWLTKREMEVLRLLATDRSYREIAAELGLSEETIRSHVKHILHKLDEPDRLHAVAAAMRAGILHN